MNEGDITKQIKPWHPLTEYPSEKPPEEADNQKVRKSEVADKQTNTISSALKKLLWDVLVYLFSTVSVRIKRLNISARAFEKAKLEGLRKEYIIEASYGKSVYLIPTERTFQDFDMPCPYKRDVFIQHSFSVKLAEFSLRKDPANKKVFTELKLTDSGNTSDVVSVNHNGTRIAWEVTHSTTNILSNATKYENTDFVTIIFLCRDYKLKQAVKASLRESGINPDLLAKIQYRHFSQLLRRQRKLSLY